jgi:hypothetical protein
MAEPTSHPEGAAGQAAETGITAIPPMPSAEAPEAYRPISLMAILGFALACLYAVAILVGAVVSFTMARTPLPLTFLLLLVPLAAAALCWVARTRILAAEGTLAGLPLTKWGLSLSLVFALIYASYFAATYFAVRQQATHFADQYFDTLKRGEIDRAFLLNRPAPARPPEGPDQRSALENELNESPNSEVNMRGPYSEFCLKDYVRMLAAGGEKSKVEFLSAGDWEYQEGGYKVPLRYQISTDLASFPMIITVHSREAAGAPAREGKGRPEGKGRQWFVVERETRPEAPPQLTAEGERIISKLNGTALPFAQLWMLKVANGDWDEVYLDCLPPKQRKGVQELLEAGGPVMAVAGPAPILMGSAEGRDFLKAKAELSRADFVRTDPKQFWADPKVREEVIASVRRVFQEARGGEPVQLSPVPAPVPLWRNEGGKVLFGYDFQAMFLPKYKAEGVIFVEADAANPDPGPGDWRVDHVEMLRVRTASPPRRPGGGGPGPMGPGAMR